MLRIFLTARFLFCAMLFVLGGCKPPGGSALLQGSGLTGSVGDIVRGYAANSRAMMEIRAKITDLVGKLNQIRNLRMNDIQDSERMERLERWMDNITQRVFSVSLKRAKACAEEFRQDLSTVATVRQLVYYAWIRQAWPALSDTEAYANLYTAMKPAVWVEFLNYRAAAIIAMLNALQYTLETLSPRKETLEKLRDELQSLSGESVY